LSEKDITKVVGLFLDDVINEITKAKNKTFVENKDAGSSTFYYQRCLFKSKVSPVNNCDSQKSLMPETSKPKAFMLN